MRNLELFNSQFGESYMKNAHVMMRDVEDSRRITHIYSESFKESPFSALVVSKFFWPRFSKDTEFILPPFVQR